MSDAAKQLQADLKKSRDELKAGDQQRLKESKERIKKQNELTNKANKETPQQSSSEGGADQKTVKCPSCGSENKIKEKVAGKYIYSITFPFTKFTMRIPNPLAFLGKVVNYDSNLKSGEKCKACEGKKEIPDVSDDSAKYQQAQQTIDQNAPALMETEAKLGTGGTRTTYIQGSDMLNVGLGFNHNVSYEVIEKGNIAPQFGGETKSPQKGGVATNAVVGKQSELAWPQSIGNYFIKCANKFNVLAGGGGITIATKGPLTLSGGTIRFSGPSLTLGSNDGPLTLEGDTVTIGGKNITLSPAGGQAHVTGALTCNNATVAGHLHTEGISFTRGSCPAVNKETSNDQANKDVTKTEGAVWQYQALVGAIIELSLFLQAIPSNTFSSKRIISVEGIQSMIDRMKATIKLAFPIELVPTGIAFGVGVSVVYNFPHHHGIPNMFHTHTVKLPDMDYSDTAEEARGKGYSAAATGGAPANLTENGAARKFEGLLRTVETTYGLVCEAYNYVSRMFK